MGRGEEGGGTPVLIINFLQANKIKNFPYEIQNI
jgi:hypothetical protein